jgi:hypothetical protein
MVDTRETNEEKSVPDRDAEFGDGAKYSTE